MACINYVGKAREPTLQSGAPLGATQGLLTKIRLTHKFKHSCLLQQSLHKPKMFYEIGLMPQRKNNRALGKNSLHNMQVYINHA